MKYTITKARETHDMELMQEWDDGFGIHWRMLKCPICERQVQIGPRIIVHNKGTMEMTQADVDRATMLRKEGRHGEANRLLASFPGHRYTTPGLELSVGIA